MKNNSNLITRNYWFDGTSINNSNSNHLKAVDVIYVKERKINNLFGTGHDAPKQNTNKINNFKE